MKKALLLAVSYLLHFTSFSQQIDSLEKILSTKNLPDKERVNTLNELCRELTFIDPIKAATLAYEALQTSYRIQYLKGQAYGYRGLSSILSANNNTSIAAEYIQRALKIFESQNDSIGIANCYITMGHAFRQTKKRREEIESHKKAFEIFSKLKIANRIAVTAHNLGESYQLNGDFNKSRELTLYAIHLNDSLHLLPVLSNCYKVMGKLEINAGNDSLAEHYFKKVLVISDELGNKSQKIATIESLIELSNIYAKKGERGQQLHYLSEAKAFSEKNLLAVYLQKIYTDLISLHANNKEEVIRYAAEYKSVLNTVNTKNLANQLELEQYSNEIYQFIETETGKLEKGLLLQEHQIKSKNSLLILSLLTGVLLTVLIFLLIRSLSKQKKVQQEIREKRDELRELAAHLQTIREDERINIAQEVHEGLGQQLIVIKMDVDWLSNNLSTKNEKVRKKAEETQIMLDNVIKRVRRIAWSLRPGMLDDLGLDIAIKWQLSEFEKIYKIRTFFNSKGDTQLLSTDIKTGLYRIFQEALINIVTHSNAKSITILLYTDEKETILVIEDDGLGFNINEIATKKNIGLLSMKERSYMINATFALKSTPGKGTIVTIKITG